MSSAAPARASVSLRSWNREVPVETPQGASPERTGQRVPKATTWMWIGALAAVAALIAGCGGSSSEARSGARDACERDHGVGNCVERNGGWVPLARALTPNAQTAVTSPPSSAPSSTSTTTTAPPPPTTAPAGPGSSPDGDVLLQPAGLLCRDLQARGYSYSAAVDYWRHHAQTNSMDADRNGLPCETVYSPSDVASYWGDIGSLPSDLPGGLACRDLVAAGLSYPDAVAYWYLDGTPSSMDADGNSIPCETVYPASDVRAYWG